jgi:AraC family transcriptional regulator, arabinose operon regulatory protein
MRKRKTTGNPIVEYILAGEYRRKSDYHNWRPAGSQDWLVILTISGAGRFVFKTGEIVAEKNSVVLYHPGVCQEYETHQRYGAWHLLWAHFHPYSHWLPWLEWPLITNGLAHIPRVSPGEMKLLAENMRDVVRYSQFSLRNSQPLAMNAFEKVILNLGGFVATAQQNRLDPRILKAVNFANANMNKAMLISELAGVAGMSLSHFSHVFRKCIGMSPMAFVEDMKLRKGASLLKMGGMQISEVAYELGYESPFYFSNRFRKYFGVSPTTFKVKSDAGRTR